MEDNEKKLKEETERLTKDYAYLQRQLEDQHDALKDYEQGIARNRRIQRRLWLLQANEHANFFEDSLIATMVAHTYADNHRELRSTFCLAVEFFVLSKHGKQWFSELYNSKSPLMTAFLLKALGFPKKAKKSTSP